MQAALILLCTVPTRPSKSWARPLPGQKFAFIDSSAAAAAAAAAATRSTPPRRTHSGTQCKRSTRASRRPGWTDRATSLHVSRDERELPSQSLPARRFFAGVNDIRTPPPVRRRPAPPTAELPVAAMSHTGSPRGGPVTPAMTRNCYLAQTRCSTRTSRSRASRLARCSCTPSAGTWRAR